MKFHVDTLVQFIKFSGIGIINTLIHIAITVVLVEIYQVNPVAANCFAFINANMFSYWANSRWSFSSDMSTQRFFKFFAVSIMGLLLTAGVTSVAQYYGLHYLIGMAVLFCLLPLVTFLSHRYWTFAEN